MAFSGNACDMGISQVEQYRQKCESIINQIRGYNKFARLGIKRNANCDEQAKEFVKNIRDNVKKNFQKFRDEFFGIDFEENLDIYVNIRRI